MVVLPIRMMYDNRDTLSLRKRKGNADESSSAERGRGKKALKISGISMLI